MRAAVMSLRYCVSATWFRAFESWVCGRAREPPGPINNIALVLQRLRETEPSLRPHVNHFKFSEDIWSLLLALYGGGPQVVVGPKGGVRVTSRPLTSHLSMTRLRERLRIRAEQVEQQKEESERESPEESREA